MAWGPELTMLYNEDYARMTLGFALGSDPELEAAARGGVAESLSA